MKKSSLLILFLVLLSNPALLLAQTEPEEIKLEENKFQDYFFEALKQKGIENYDKAIVALEQCSKIESENATVHFELGKNYLALKDYKNAYTSFEHATQIDPTNKWFWVGMYDVNYATKDFNSAIYVINKLIFLDSKFKEDLTSLYISTNQYDKALALINELDETSGKTDRREAYKAQIFSQGKYQNTEIANLIAQVQTNPKEESNYLSLIFLYSKNNETDKVLETARKLELAIPTSEWAQVSLFKTHLENNDGKKAVKSMNIALASAKIDFKIKHRILNEFLIFAEANPQFAADLEKAIGYFDNDPDVNVAKEIGKFYQTKKQWDSTVSYYELANKKGSTGVDIETNLLLLQAYTETKQFEKLMKNAVEMIDVFPTQPQFYYYAGLGCNQMTQFKKAKEILEMGLDYLVEDIILEINFNIQLGEAYSGLGDSKKKDFYFSKANQLLKNKIKMNKFLAVLVVVFMLSCKSKAIVAGATAPIISMKAKNIIASHYDNKSDFSTLYIKASVKYSDEKQSQNVTAEIRMKKDEQIVVSIRFFGITMAKASITPTSVSYYEKIKGTYFEGNFSALSQWLGTDLDFYKIQNMLLGEALDDLKKGKYTESVIDQLYRLDDKDNDNTKKTFYINSNNFSVNRQEITQTAEERMIQVAYTYIEEYKEAILPATVVIHTYQKNGKSEINLEYDTITFNEELSFPYSVPNSYNRIIIK